MKRIALEEAPLRMGAGYPPPFDARCVLRRRRQLAMAAGLAQLGINRLELPPGQWSSQRHWHHRSEEFVYILEGEVWLVTDDDEERLTAGDGAGFPAGEANGHHFQNRSAAIAVLLEIGTNMENDIAEYPDIDLRSTDDGYIHKDGRPYAKTG